MSGHGISAADAQRMNPKQWQALKPLGIDVAGPAAAKQIIGEMQRLERAAPYMQGLQDAMNDQSIPESQNPQTGVLSNRGTHSQPNAAQSGPAPANQGAPVSQPGGSGNSGWYGQETSVRIPGENRGYKATYAVVEKGDVIPSHNPFNLESNPQYRFRNDRNYSDPRNAERIVKQVSEFDPYYLVNDSPDATNGAPVIDMQGNVLGGNSRTMTLQRIYGQRPDAAAAYKELLAQKAPQFGLRPEDVRAMNEPIWSGSSPAN